MVTQVLKRQLFYSLFYYRRSFSNGFSEAGWSGTGTKCNGRVLAAAEATFTAVSSADDTALVIVAELGVAITNIWTSQYEFELVG